MIQQGFQINESLFSEAEELRKAKNAQSLSAPTATQSNTQAVGAVAGALGGTGESGGGAAGGAAAGLQAGASTGNPYAAAGGAVIGGVLGGIQAEKDAKDKKDKADAQALQNIGAIEQNAGTARANAIQNLASNISQSLLR